MTARNDGMVVQKVYLGVFTLLVVAFVLAVTVSLIH